MSARASKGGALHVITCAAEKLRTTSGQAFSDPTLRAVRQLEQVFIAASSVIEAKEIYYSQRFDNADAQDVALTLWSDRVDALNRACEEARSAT